MARIYKPATFQPTVRPDWGGALSYLPESEKAEILEAIIKYPSKDCNSAFWLETIKPDLDFQYETFVGACKKKSQGIRDRWGKISTTYLQHMNNISTTDVQDMNKISDTYVIDVEEKDKNKDKEKDKNKIDIYTRFNAGFQNWKFEPALLAIAKKYWKAETIRKIEIDFSCQEYNTETSVQELLERYPTDVSKGFKKPTLDEVKAYCRERMNMVDPEKWYNFYSSNGWKVGKNPMKDWKAAVRTWEKSGYNNQQTQIPKMSLKEMQEMQKRVEIQKILNGVR